MSTNSKIEWTESTWNPVSGCTRVSAGCDNCYAVKHSHRLATQFKQEKYAGLTVLNAKGHRHFNGVVKCHEDALDIPMKRKKPTMYFVNSMSDLFHGGLYGQGHADATWKDGQFNAAGFEFLLNVWHVMRKCPQHTFQILTKRPRIMADLVWRVMAKLNIQEPLSNVWPGTSIENQATADERIPHLLRCPAAIRFLSVEPLLGPVRLPKRLTGMASGEVQIGSARDGLIDWVIVGGESKGRMAHRFQDGYEPAARLLMQQCQAAGVAFFHKQMPVNGRISHDMSEWPADLRVREFPR